MKKYVRKQTIKHRLERLKNGNCPIHGLSMYQIAIFNNLNVVECSRKDCQIKAYEKEPYENAILFDEFKYLLEKDFS
jgi:hypothetical protein